jgi:hypothetical protein
MARSPLPHLKVTVSDHQNNPFGIQWQRYWDGAPYPDLVKIVPHVAFEIDDLAEAIRNQKVIIDPNSPSTGVDFHRPLHFSLAYIG